jgi:hypothetical protein
MVGAMEVTAPRTVAVVFALTLALAPAACSAGGAPQRAAPEASSATPAPASADPSAPATATAGGTPSPGKVVENEVGEAHFALPSKNIACLMIENSVRCDIAEKSWTPPPKPANCPLDYGFGVFVRGDAPANILCTGDTVLGATRILPYGHALRMRTFVCTSLESGVGCRNDATRHGFTLSRSSYELF